MFISKVITSINKNIAVRKVEKKHIQELAQESADIYPGYGTFDGVWAVRQEARKIFRQQKKAQVEENNMIEKQIKKNRDSECEEHMGCNFRGPFSF